MAHDRMTDDNAERNMGRTGQADDMGNQDFGRQTPGRNPQQNDQQTGQKGAGQKNNPLEDDDFSPSGEKPGQSRQSDVGRGGQNQNR
jgi:hypothetical protein